RRKGRHQPDPQGTRRLGPGVADRLAAPRPRPAPTPHRQADDARAGLGVCGPPPPPAPPPGGGPPWGRREADSPPVAAGGVVGLTGEGPPRRPTSRASAIIRRAQRA